MGASVCPVLLTNGRQPRLEATPQGTAVLVLPAGSHCQQTGQWSGAGCRSRRQLPLTLPSPKSAHTSSNPHCRMATALSSSSADWAGLQSTLNTWRQAGRQAAGAGMLGFVGGWAVGIEQQ